MTPSALKALIAVVLLTAPCPAQDWARKMFEKTSHDFGTVARGAKAEYAFVLTNNRKTDVHIAGVRASCGCTTPRIAKKTLKPYEKGAIVAHINSDSFLGDQGATLTVTIDKPSYAEVQLDVKVYVRSEVTFDPTSVLLGNVNRGTAVEKKISVSYSGRKSDWRILEVKSGNPQLSGQVTEKTRRGKEVSYELMVRLEQDAPPGYVSEQLRLITNEPRANHLSVPVEGHVLAAISVSPSSLFLGVVQPGQSVTKQIVVRGQKPFRIASIRGDCECLKATTPKDQEAKSLYVVPVTFTAGEKTGKITQVVHIETDSGQTVLNVPTYAVVAGS